MTLVEIPKITSGWRAGQHVRIRIVSRTMGALRWAECHPFTIASVSKVRILVNKIPVDTLMDLYLTVGSEWRRRSGSDVQEHGQVDAEAV